MKGMEREREYTLRYGCGVGVVVGRTLVRWGWGGPATTCLAWLRSNTKDAPSTEISSHTAPPSPDDVMVG
jgi:hypothetical protein